MIFAFAETKLIITHWLVLGILFWKKKITINIQSQLVYLLLNERDNKVILWLDVWAYPKPIHLLLLHYTLRALFPAIMTNRLTLFPPKHGPPNELTQLRHKQIFPGHLYL